MIFSCHKCRPSMGKMKPVDIGGTDLNIATNLKNKTLKDEIRDIKKTIKTSIIKDPSNRLDIISNSRYETMANVIENSKSRYIISLRISIQNCELKYHSIIENIIVRNQFTSKNIIEAFNRGGNFFIIKCDNKKSADITREFLEINLVVKFKIEVSSYIKPMIKIVRI